MIKIQFETGTFLEINATTLMGYDFSRMNLHRAILDSLCLDFSLFREAHLRNISIENSSVKNADFYNAALMNAFLKNSDMTGCDFQNSRPIAANFSHSVLINSNFAGADISRADFSGANLCGANLCFERYDEVTLAGALFDENTRWPDKFDPVKEGAILCTT
ncbi:pentapeptide repeat-containing protein [Intestinirhabdus alba]|jgi:uncharacterized protein YjbI with pentapeptide repeats|uniref:Pentapeptide repeat-containing protein n=1 Tax=Intestinirhabdus alba TaxID=2899544 RepID=A0A6L6IMA7_9ENTR|nr:pentapeptide repeat-containing protein [Intestinirhabdus alba]MTH47007.1 pentapeptide repeat-containing protein [Intestinirhabdus alba]